MQWDASSRAGVVISRGLTSRPDSLSQEAAGRKRAARDGMAPAPPSLAPGRAGAYPAPEETRP
jgi:hypothetical protein